MVYFPARKINHNTGVRFETKSIFFSIHSSLQQCRSVQAVDVCAKDRRSHQHAVTKATARIIPCRVLIQPAVVNITCRSRTVYVSVSFAGGASRYNACPPRTLPGSSSSHIVRICLRSAFFRPTGVNATHLFALSTRYRGSFSASDVVTSIAGNSIAQATFFPAILLSFRIKVLLFLCASYEHTLTVNTYLTRAPVSHTVQMRRRQL